MNPRVSVLMPAYNAEKYIGAAIESILNQTFTDFELIIVNDGSTDNTTNIIHEYEQHDNRIRFINNRINSGLVAVLNQGLDLCRGEYIARMDSDDIARKNRLELQVKYMDAHPGTGLLGGAYQMFGTKSALITLPCDVKILDLLKQCCVAHPTVMMRTSVLRKYQLYYDPEYQHAEDYELWSRMIRYTEIQNLPDILLDYRWHGENISAKKSDIQLNNSRKIQQNILDYLTTNPKYQNILSDIFINGNDVVPGFKLPRWMGRIIRIFIFNRTARHTFDKRYVHNKKGLNL